MTHPDLVTFSSDLAEVMTHVLSCPLCRQRALRVLFKTLSGEVNEPEDRADYKGLWIRLAATRRSAALDLTRERSQAPALLDELLALDPPERSTRVRQDPRYATYTLAQLLIERALSPSWEEQSEGLARLALEVVHHLADNPAPPEVIRDLEALARTTLAEVLRRRGDLAAAEIELLQVLQAPHGLADTRAMLSQVLGTLRRDQDRLYEAVALLEHAAELWSQVGNGPAEMALWTELGEMALEAADAKRALALFDLAAAVPEASKAQELQVLCGTARALALLGRCQEGLELLRESQPRFERGSKEELTLRGLEGRLETELGRLVESRRTLASAYAGLKSSQAWYEAVQAGVALAGILPPGSRRVRGLLAELPDLARRGRLPQGAQDALGALAVGTLPLSDVHRLSEYLERTRLRPHLKWATGGNRWLN